MRRKMRLPSAALGICVLVFLGLAAPVRPSLAAAPEVQYLDAPALKAMMGDPNLVIIDTSTGWWTYDKKIPGSLVYPEEATVWASKIPKDKKIVLYCG